MARYVSQDLDNI